MRKAGLLALGLLAGAGVAFWLAPVATLNALARIENVRVTTDRAYADGTRHGLDVYAPAGGGKGRPVVVFFYGGGWEDGERALYRFVGSALASRGFVTIIPDYRVYPEVRFPDFLEDGARAVRWARDHAGEFGGDEARLFLAGHSAGAHIAAMLALDGQWMAAEGMDSRRDIAGLIGLAGPYDFLPLHSRTLEEIFGPEQTRALSQPINFVAGGEPPAFLATGLNDITVDPGNTSRLAARLGRQGDRVTTRFYPRVDHRTLIGALSPPLRLFAPVLDDVAAFIDATPARGSGT